VTTEIIIERSLCDCINETGLSNPVVENRPDKINDHPLFAKKYVSVILPFNAVSAA
tara:strand:- start:1506 stop:1673 length:168 start_codon:yes stop_codon:yes gene_type:complete